MKKLLLAALLTTPLLLSGCVISVHDDDNGKYGLDFHDREENNREHLAGLNIGDPLDLVTRKMGVADFDELKQSDEGPVRVLYYRTQRHKKDGITTKDECTPIVFVNNEIVGWGESALREI